MSIFDNCFSEGEGLNGGHFSPEQHFPEISGFNEYSELSNQDIETLIKTLLPAGHLDGCESITCNPSNPFWAQHGALGYYYEGSEGHPPEICIAGKEMIEGIGCSEIEVLCHEIGHNAYINMDVEDMQKWAEIHTNSQILYDQTGFGFVSSYAHTNLSEDFAETYSAYITNPDFLQFVSPEKYEFMQEQVFGGVEYAQISAGAGEAILVTKDVANSYAQIENQLFNFDAAIASSEQNAQTDALYRCFDKIA